MANASVEKLKALGIRHGEKAVVGLTATLFVVFTALAIIRPTMEMKPEELSSASTNAQGNLNKQQPVPDVLAKLEKDGLVDPNFVAIVDNQIKNALKPEPYRAKLEWVTPEPGAGLIRDQPELIAPTEVAAFPGRGGIQIYKLDEKGDKIPDNGDAKKAGKAAKKPGRVAKDDKEAEEKRLRLFAGKAEAGKDKEKDKEKAKDEPAAEAGPVGPFVEETQGKRWVVITAVIDNEQMKKNYLLALKNPAIAYPNYKQVDVERRSQQSDGSWTDWAKTDQDKNYAVIDNATELEPELIPASQLPQALVDPLPYLRAGYWSGVHVARLVPADVLEAAKNKPPAGGGGGGGKMGPGGGMMGPGGAGGGAMGSGGMEGNESRMGSQGGKFSGMTPGGGGAGMGMEGRPGSSSPGPGSSGPSGGGGGGGDADEMNFPKLDEKNLMIRSLDFTVDQDTTYQYRIRIVVRNPNWNHTDVNPGVDVDSKYLSGPWSDPTDPVTLPADVSAYAQAPEPTPRRDDLVSFQVIKWDAGSGQTLVKTDGAGPGEFVGEFGSIQMPSSEGKGPKPANIDFNSRAIVLDTFGGSQKLPDLGVERNQFVVPAVAMLVEPDGSVVVRNQAIDRSDAVRDDMESNYKQALADSGKTREVGSGSKMGGAGGDPRQGSNKKKKKKKR